MKLSRSGGLGRAGWILLFAVTLSPAARADAPAPPDRVFSLAGSIDSGAYPIRMNLVRTGRNLSGSYSYHRAGTPLMVSGQESPDGRVTLTERDRSWNETGRFEGRWGEGDVLAGTWTEKPRGTSEGYPRPPRRLGFSLQPDTSAACFMPFVLDDTRFLLSHRRDSESPRAELRLLYLQPTSLPAGVAPAVLNRVRRGLRRFFTGKDAASDSPSVLLDRMRREYFEEYFEAGKDYDSASYDYAWTWAREAIQGIFFNARNVLVVEQQDYSYMGGAHGVGTSSFAIFDLRTGLRVGLNDLFKTSNRRALAALVERRSRSLIASRREQPEGDLELLVESFPLTENVYLTSRGIGFYYNVYEIASYADGPIDVFLTWSEMEPFLKRGSLAERVRR